MNHQSGVRRPIRTEIVADWLRSETGIAGLGAVCARRAYQVALSDSLSSMSDLV
jgi:hypothetical protein